MLAHRSCALRVIVVAVDGEDGQPNIQILVLVVDLGVAVKEEEDSS